jgi:anthranilate synthase component 2
MAVRHRELPRFGVQFHPESILSPDAASIFARFLAFGAARVPS